MEDKSNNSKKPLRSMTNKVKDLMDTYKKDNFHKEHEGKHGSPISSPEQAKEIFNNIEENENLNNNSNNNANNKFGSNESDLILNQEEAMMVANRIEELEKEKEELEKEKNELKEQLLRNAAEMENFRRRTLKEKQELIDYANEKLLFKMLAIIDDFSAALDAGKKSSDFDALMTGIDMIYNKTVKLFEENGVKAMESSVGKPFNVDFNDALMVMPSDLPESYVVQEVSPGYMIHEKVLRHSKVVTSSGQAAQADE